MVIGIGRYVDVLFINWHHRCYVKKIKIEITDTINCQLEEDAIVAGTQSGNKIQIEV
jgi:hypothetical protein